MVTKNDFIVKDLYREDLVKIWQYVKVHFPESRYDEQTIKDNWINLEKPNPNYTGIVAERAFFDEINVEWFLANRPTQPDMGDGIAYPHYQRALVFDIKGAFWDNSYSFDLFRPNFLALVKAVNIEMARERGIDAFVFGVIKSDEMKCYYTGWIGREDLATKGTERNVGAFRLLGIEHRRLNPLSSLCAYGCEQFTQKMLEKKTPD